MDKIMEWLTNPAIISIMDLIKIGGIIWGIILASVKFGKLLGNFKTIDVKFEAIDKRFETLEKNLGYRFDSIDSTLKDLKRSVDKIDENTTAINSDLSKLEGAFEERGKWESKLSVET